MALNISADDVANNVGPAVGSRALVGKTFYYTHDSCCLDNDRTHIRSLLACCFSPLQGIMM
jgi:hypothetical protein